MDIMIAMMRKKPGMSRDSFINYYETHHAPLIMSIVGEFIHSYERHYLDYTHKYTRISAAESARGFAPLDVITRIVWNDLEASRQAMADPKNALAIATDEENFLDRETMQVVIVPDDGYYRLTKPEAHAECPSNANAAEQGR